MNYLPLTFYDEIMHRLSRTDVGRLMYTSGRWSSIAKTHFNRRRELNATLRSNRNGTKVGVEFFRIIGKVPFEIDSKYDRIRCIEFSPPYDGDDDDEELNEEDEAVNETLDHFQTKTLPIIRSVASDCTLHVSETASDSQQKLCDIIFDGLKECRGLSEIIVDNYGETCQEFIRRQIELGSLKRLTLLGNTTFGQDLDRNWPMDFQDSIKVFVKSPRFLELDIRDADLTLDFDVVSCVFDRVFNGELTYFDLKGSPSFPLDDLRSLYPQFAVIPDNWPSQESTAVWKAPHRERKINITVCYQEIKIAVFDS